MGKKISRSKKVKEAEEVDKDLERAGLTRTRMWQQRRRNQQQW